MVVKLEKRFQYFFIAPIVGVLNLLCATNKGVAALIVAFELVVLLYHMRKGMYGKCFCFYVLFLAFSLEFADFAGVDVLYGFKEFRIGGINIAYLFLLLFSGVVFLVYGRYYKKNASVLYKYFVVLLYAEILATLIGLLVMVIEHPFNSFAKELSIIIDAVYTVSFPLLMLYTAILIFHCEPNASKDLSCTIKAIFWGEAISIIVAYILNLRGIYGGARIILSSNIWQLMPFCLLFLGYHKYRSKNLMYWIITLTGLGLGLYYNASGKYILCIGLSFIIIIIKQNKPMYEKLIWMIVSVVGCIGIIVVLPHLMNSIQFLSKWIQVKGLFSFGKGWFANMPSSPKARVAEIGNIAIEYLHKPWYLLTGKGFGGTICDYLNALPSGKGSYGIDQIGNNAYYNMHEAINKLFLQNGCVGIYIIVKNIKLFIKYHSQNPYIIIGIAWFLLFFEYSMTLSTVGVVSLALGLFLLDDKKVLY